MMSKRLMIVFILLIGLLTACSTPAATPAPDDAVSSDDVGDDGSGGGEIVFGESATVETLTLNILESFPVQVIANVTGYTPNGCITVSEISAMRQDQTFTIKIVTAEQTGMACTEALVPFDQSVTLDVEGLPAGTYTVEAYGQSVGFALEVDNEDPMVVADAECPLTDGPTIRFVQDDLEAGYGYCFLYPDDFQPDTSNPDIPTVAGPKYGDEPGNQAMVVIETHTPDGMSLQDYVNADVGRMGVTPNDVSMESIKLGGEDAIVIENVPIQVNMRIVYTLHNDIIFRLSFIPLDWDNFPEATSEMERLINLVLGSWVFYR